MIGFVFSPTDGEAAKNYAIQFKNQTTIVTDRYWKEGNQIKCNFMGGIVGFYSDKIESIVETELDVQKPHTDLENQTSDPAKPNAQEPSADQGAPEPGNLEPISSGPLSEGIEAESLPSESAEILKGKPDPLSISNQNKFLDKRDILIEEMRKNRTQIQEAKEQGYKDQQREFEKKFIDLTKDLKTLFDEVVKANGGTPPDWWPKMWSKDMVL
jgi:hypothetical protein